MADFRFRAVPKLIVFDLDGTLYRQRPLRWAMAGRILSTYAAQPIEGFRTLRALGAYRQAQEHLRGETSKNLADLQISVAAKRAGFSSETIARYVRRWMEQEPLPMLPRFVCRGLIDFLRRCRASGIRLAVLSDYPAVGKLQSLGIADFFDVVLSAQSREIGAFKPNPKGLMTAMQRFGVAGHECLYIGDRVDVDAAAAQAAGVPCAILTTRPAAFSDGFLTVEDYPQLQNLLFGLGHASVGESFQPS